LNSFEGFVKGMAAITQLRQLDMIDFNQQVRTASVLPFTSLTMLTELRLHFVAKNAQPVNGSPLELSLIWVTKVSQARWWRNGIYRLLAAQGAYSAWQQQHG
jgi:hypothetical protein